jgi:hypothetical protein
MIGWSSSTFIGQPVACRTGCNRSFAVRSSLFGFLEIKRLVAVQLPPNLAKDWTRLDFQTLHLGHIHGLDTPYPGKRLSSPHPVLIYYHYVRDIPQLLGLGACSHLMHIHILDAPHPAKWLSSRHPVLIVITFLSRGVCYLLVATCSHWSRGFLLRGVCYLLVATCSHGSRGFLLCGVCYLLVATCHMGLGVLIYAAYATY